MAMDERRRAKARPSTRRGVMRLLTPLGWACLASLGLWAAVLAAIAWLLRHL